MSAALTEFEKGTADLRAYIVGLQLERQLLAATSSEPPCSDSDRIAVAIRANAGTGSNKKRFDYNTVVISLYGLFEQLVEGLIEEYAQQLRSCSAEYASLPDRFRSAHADLTVELLPRLEYGRYKCRLKVEQVVRNLHLCLSGDPNYALNVEALQQHSSNFRADVLGQTFTRIGVEQVLQRLPHYSPFEGFLTTLFPGETVGQLSADRLFGVLNNLADWRNDVAHGTVSEIQSNEILEATLDYLEALVRALTALIDDETIAFEAATRGVRLGKPIAVFNHSIVCFEMRNQGLRKGDLLVALGKFWPFQCLSAPIEELQVDNVTHEEVVAVPSVKVGCRVAFRAKEGYTYVLLPRT